MNERASQRQRGRMNRDASARAGERSSDLPGQRAADLPLDRPSPVDYLEYEALTLEAPEARPAGRRGRTWPALGLAWVGFGIGAASLLAPRQVARAVPRRFAYVAVGALAAFGLVSSYLAAPLSGRGTGASGRPA